MQITSAKAISQIVKIFATALLTLGSFAPCALGQASFQGLGAPGGYFYVYACALSPDGTRASLGAVTLDYYSTEGFIWDAEAGLQPIGQNNLIYGIGPDNDTLVGGAHHQGPNAEAFRLDSQAGLQWLGLLPNTTYSFSHGVSDDGTVVAGLTDKYAFRWTQATGITSLGHLPSANQGGSRAWAISRDGSTIVGDADVGDPDGNAVAVRWTASGGMQSLGALPDASYPTSVAYAVSANGQVIGGKSFNENNWVEAFRWTVNDGMTGIGSTASESGIFGVSDDGDVMVGYDFGLATPGASIWDAQHGMRSLKAVLDSLGVSNASSWLLGVAIAVSSDGQVILGNGVDPQGYNEVWIARIPRAGSCPGDTNGDQVIDLADLALTLSEYGQVGQGFPGDLNNDGAVDLGDLALLLANFGEVCA